MKFVTKSQFHQESDCGHFFISMAMVSGSVVFTLTHDGKLIAQEKCGNFAIERKEAMNILKQKAGEL